jgi:hypothetical protein
MAAARRILSPEIVSLIHHVELNQRGWWKKAMVQVVQAALWLQEQPCDLPALRATVQSQLGANPTPEALQKAVDALLSSKTIQLLPNKKYKLSEAAKAQFADIVEKSKQDQTAAEHEFSLALQHFCRQLDPQQTWKKFADALGRAIARIGANAYHLLVDGTLEKDFDWLNDFLKLFPAEDQEGLKAALATFFRPACSASRAFVLQRLTAYFFMEAAQLRQETIEAVEARQGKRRTIRLVLDTNVLFSVLGMHENPMDSTAESLLTMATNAEGPVEVRLLVLPSTVEEARRVLSAIEASLEGIRYARVVSAAAAKMPLSSVAARYFAQNAQAGGALSPREYFAPYTENLTAVLRTKGVDILSWPLDHYVADQRVVDSIIDWREHEQRTRREDQRRQYEAIQHDMILWHALRDHRTEHTDSPLDVDTWGVTLDGRLVGFDVAKRRRLGVSSAVPLVLHLTNMVQLLQFWIPRSDALEASIMDTLRLPLFFPAFDERDEETTIGILKAISRYENADDLPEEAVRSIVANQALRSRIQESNASSQETFEFVRDALIEEHKKAAEESRRAREELAASKNQIATMSEKVHELTRAHATAEAAIAERDSIAAAEREARKIAERDALEKQEYATKLTNRLESTEARLQSLEHEQRRRALGTLALISVALSCGVGVAAAMSLRMLSRNSLSTADVWTIGATAAVAAQALAFRLLQGRVLASKDIERSWLGTSILFCSRRFLWPLLVLVFLAVLEAGALSWLQQLSVKVWGANGQLPVTTHPDHPKQ